MPEQSAQRIVPEKRPNNLPDSADAQTAITAQNTRSAARRRRGFGRSVGMKKEMPVVLSIPFGASK